MAEDLHATNISVFTQDVNLRIFDGSRSILPPTSTTDQKRRITFRLAASGLLGADHAVEYLYGK